jgi:hypothetical protein
MTPLLRRMWCRARCGHDWMLMFGPHRLFLVCPTCLAETAGWMLPDTTGRSPARRPKVLPHTRRTLRRRASCSPSRDQRSAT